MAAKLLDLLSRDMLVDAVNDAVVAAVLEQLGLIELPPDYLEFLRISNGACGLTPDGAYLDLYRLEDVPGVTESCGASEFAPGLVIVGSDGGGTAFGIDTRGNAGGFPYVQVGFVGLELESPENRTGTLFELLRDFIRSVK